MVCMSSCQLEQDQKRPRLAFERRAKSDAPNECGRSTNVYCSAAGQLGKRKTIAESTRSSAPSLALSRSSVSSPLLARRRRTLLSSTVVVVNRPTTANIRAQERGTRVAPDALLTFSIDARGSFASQLTYALSASRALVEVLICPSPHHLHPPSSAPPSLRIGSRSSLFCRSTRAIKGFSASSSSTFSAPALSLDQDKSSSAVSADVPSISLSAFPAPPSKALSRPLSRCGSSRPKQLRHHRFRPASTACINARLSQSVSNDKTIKKFHRYGANAGLRSEVGSCKGWTV